MSTVKSVIEKVKIANDTKSPDSSEVFEKSAKYSAMRDAVMEAIAHPANKESSQMSSMSIPKAFSFLTSEVIGELQDYTPPKVPDIHLDDEEKKQEIVKKGNVVEDYYQRLGIDKDASPEEIKSARNRLLREYRSDILTAQGKSPEEIAEAEENAKQVNEAYYYLSNSQRREEYDKHWEKTYSSGSKPPDEESLMEESGSGYAYINISTSPQTKSKPSDSSKKQALSFQEVVKHEGGGVTPWLVSEMRLSGLLPEGFSESQVVGAAHMYARGVTSEGLLNAVDGVDSLSDAEKKSIGNMALFVEYMEASDGTIIPNSQTILESTNSPHVSVSSGESPQGISFSRDGAGGLNFIFEQAGGFVSDKAGGLVKKEVGKIGAKTAVGKAIKEGGKKVLAEGSKVLAKAGAKLGIKLAEKAALSAVFESLNAIAPGLGTLLDVIVNWVLPVIFGAVKKFLKSLTDPETLGKLLFAFAGIATMLGAPMLGAGLLGGGLFSFMKGKGGGSFANGLNMSFSAAGVVATAALAATVAAVGWPLLFALLIIPMTLAIIVVTMTTGAYVVPPFLPHTSPQMPVENPYMDVVKTLRAEDSSKCVSSDNTPTHIKCRNEDLPIKVQYTVTITAKRGPMTNFQFKDNCRVDKEDSGSPNCPPAQYEYDPNNPPAGNDVSPTEPYALNYTRTFNNVQDFYDSIVYDTATITATSAEGNTETVSASASMCIGKCPMGCFVVSDARKPWSLNGRYKQDVIEATTTLSSQFNGFVRKACSDGKEIPICYGGSSPDGRWGDHFGHGSECDITLYTNSDGTPNNYTDVLYVLTHETGHHITHVAPEYFSQYRSYQGIGSELALCNNSVSTDPPDVFGFCDSTALYVSNLPMTRFRACGSSGTVSEVYPAHASFAENVMLK